MFHQKRNVPTTFKYPYNSSLLRHFPIIVPFSKAKQRAFSHAEHKKCQRENQVKSRNRYYLSSNCLLSYLELIENNVP